MQSQNQILVSSHGLAADEKVALITSIKLLIRDGKTCKLVSDNTSKAHLLVLNPDTKSGQDCFKNSRAGQVKLLISNDVQTGKNIIPVKKPVEIAALKELLGKLFEKMQHQIEISMHNIPQPGYTNATTDSPPASSLFHLLLDTKENCERVYLGFADYPELVVDGTSKSVATLASDEQLKQIIRLPLADIRIEPSGPVNEQAKICSLDDLLWMTAINCSRGQLLPGHNINEPVRLKAWPNFTRKDFRPSHLKLAAILARRPVALEELQQLTGVPMAEIIDFYNAAWAVDLVERNTARTVATANPPRKISQKKKGLLGKIASKLGFGNHKLNIAGV